MAEFVPIRGLRYNIDVVPDLSAVITPPYDVISETEQKNYYQKSPYNIIRLEYGKTSPLDTEVDNRYTRAAATLKMWQERKILQQDVHCFYLYEQQYSYRGQTLTRTALTGGPKLTPYTEKIVLPHEETFSKPKADRLTLLRYCQANFSPIFGLYDDQKRELEQLYKSVKNSLPVINFTDDTGQLHSLWKITGHNMQKKIGDFFKSRCIYIADGHHRYETALRFANEMRRQGRKGFEHVLMTLVNLYDPGLLILPTHRLIQKLANLDTTALLQALAKDFDVKEYQDKNALQAFLEQLQELGKTQIVFGFYIRDHLYILSLKNQTDHQMEQKLDAAVLQKLVLEKILGINSCELQEGDYLSYTRDAAAAINSVDNGDSQATFLLNPTKIEQVINMARVGVKMPQKSTYFYPKLCSGLVINKLGG